MAQQLHIAIDGNEANTDHRVGSNVYAFKLLEELEFISRDQEVVFTVLLASDPVEDMPESRSGWQYRVIKPKLLWTRLALPIHLGLHKDSYDLLYTPGHYGPWYSPVPYVSSVMDTAYLTHPKYFKWKDRIKLEKWTKHSVDHAQHVITISDHSKENIQQHYDRAPNDISIIPPAPVEAQQQRFTKEQVSQTKKRLGIEGPFILHLGTLQPRKNLVRLIEAFEKLSRRIVSQEIVEEEKERRTQLSDFAGLQLVLAGKPGWLTEKLERRLEQSPFKDRIVQTGFITAESKEILLRDAETLAMIGLSEGFGIPAIEAINRNTIPVIADNSSLPEAIGPGGIHVNPLDTNSIADGLERALLMTVRDEREILTAGKQYIENFSWEGSAKKLLTLLKKQANKAMNKNG